MTIAAVLLAAALSYGPYTATVTRVIDGDTFTATVPLWPDGQEIHAVIRIAHIDAPELRGKCEAEKGLAVEARAVLQALLLNKTVILDDVRIDKYGRALAEVQVDDVDVSTSLVEGGLAKPYEGGLREGWCE